MIDIINTENSDRDFGDANNDEVLESYEKKPLSIYTVSYTHLTLPTNREV